MTNTNRHPAWLQPWSRFLSSVVWSGTENVGQSDLEAESPSLFDDNLLTMPVLPVPQLPANAMLHNFSKLLQCIPWGGSTRIQPHNRLSEVQR